MNADSDSITFTDLQGLTSWLRKFHKTRQEIWIRIYKKDSGIESITIDEALSAALCFGWIDGQRKGYDEDSYLQRYCPRRSKSTWSKRNVALVEALIKAERMMPAGMKAIEAAKVDGRWGRAYDGQKSMKVPEDFLRELRKCKEAYARFKALKKAEVFSIYFKLQSASTPETRKRRIETAIESLGKVRSSKKV